MYSDKSDKENDQEHDESDNEVLGKSEESDTDTSERQDDSYIDPEPVEPLKETTYMEQSHEELGEVRTPLLEPRSLTNSRAFLHRTRHSICLACFPQRVFMCHMSFQRCILDFLFAFISNQKNTRMPVWSYSLHFHVCFLNRILLDVIVIYKVNCK